MLGSTVQRPSPDGPKLPEPKMLQNAVKFDSFTSQPEHNRDLLVIDKSAYVLLREFALLWINQQRKLAKMSKVDIEGLSVRKSDVDGSVWFDQCPDFVATTGDWNFLPRSKLIIFYEEKEQIERFHKNIENSYADSFKAAIEF